MQWKNHESNLSEINQNTIELIAREYTKAENPWFLGFSGGKDSSALLMLLYHSLLLVGDISKPVTVLYCDTGVEIPIIQNLVVDTLQRLKIESEEFKLPLRILSVKPDVSNTFFVKVIGRGYPSPTNKFRWCTRRLRINPVQELINVSNHQSSTVLLGTRRGESQDRDKTLSNYKTDNAYYFRQSENNNTIIFSPIVNYSTIDVWSTIFELETPKSIDGMKLHALYKDASGECPLFRDPSSPPCGKGRFGCWTCTVVRKDRAVSSMISKGYDELVPLLEFRNWLAEIRDDPSYRCTLRRNGRPGLGPFTLAARQEILYRLLKTQDKVPWQLISFQEIEMIKSLWSEDLYSDNYCES